MVNQQGRNAIASMGHTITQAAIVLMGHGRNRVIVKSVEYQAHNVMLVVRREIAKIKKGDK
jgi:hypothetical protein